MKTSKIFIANGATYRLATIYIHTIVLFIKAIAIPRLLKLKIETRD
jgi:hypothetical protein